MKKNRHQHFLPSAFAMFCAMSQVGAMPGDAEPSVRFSILPQSQVSIQGDSNVTSWACDNYRVFGNLELMASREFVRDIYNRLSRETLTQEEGDLDLPEDWIKEGEMIIRVSDLECGNRGIERDLRKALLSEQHPDIRFKLTGIRAGGPVDPHANKGLRLHCQGELTMAGAHKDLALDLAVLRIGEDRYQVQATMPLKMTDFIEAPPTALLGLVRVANEVHVNFDLLMTDNPGPTAKATP